MTDEQKKSISEVMHREWDDPEKREARLSAMHEAADRRRIHTDITANQLDNDEARRQYQREYQRIYQRKYRQMHPDYYRKYYTPKKQKENVKVDT